MSKNRPYRPGGGNSGHEHPFGPAEAGFGMGVMLTGFAMGTIALAQEAGRHLTHALGPALTHHAELAMQFDPTNINRLAVSAGAVVVGAAMTAAGVYTSPERY